MAGSGPAMETNYLLLGVAVLQVIIILALQQHHAATWGQWFRLGQADGREARRSWSVVLAFVAWPAEASAAVPGTMFLVTTATLFWMLISANLGSCSWCCWPVERVAWHGADPLGTRGGGARTGQEAEGAVLRGHHPAQATQAVDVGMRRTC